MRERAAGSETNHIAQDFCIFSFSPEEIPALSFHWQTCCYGLFSQKVTRSGWSAQVFPHQVPGFPWEWLASLWGTCKSSGDRSSFSDDCLSLSFGVKMFPFRHNLKYPFTGKQWLIWWLKCLCKWAALIYLASSPREWYFDLPGQEKNMWGLIWAWICFPGMLNISPVLSSLK